MSLKKMLLLFYVVCSHFVVIKAEQPFNVTWGKVYKHAKQTRIDKVIGVTDQYFYLLRVKNSVFWQSDFYWIEKYDNETLELLTSNELILENAKTDRIKLLDFKTFNSQIYAFAARYAQDTTYFELYAIEHTGRASGIKQTLLSFANSTAISLPSVKLSADHSKLLIYAIEYGKPTHILHFKTFATQSFTTLQQQAIELNKIEEPKILKAIVSNNGMVYYLLERNNGIKKDKRHSKLIFDVLAFSNNNSKAFEINMPNKIITDVFLDDASIEYLFVTGFAKETNGNKLLFYFKIDNDSLNLLQKDFKTLDNKLFQSQTRNIFYADDDYDHYTIDAVWQKKENDAFVIAEKSFVQTVCSGGFRIGNICNDYYYSLDILVNKINKMGSIEWSLKVPKTQLSINERSPYQSHLSFANQNRLYLVYNDHQKNLNNKQLKMMSSAGRSIAVLAEIDSLGSIKKSLFYNNQSNDVVFNPNFRIKLKNGDFIIMANDSRRYQFGRIRFAH